MSARQGIWTRLGELYPKKADPSGGQLKLDLLFALAAFSCTSQEQRILRSQISRACTDRTPRARRKDPLSFDWFRGLLPRYLVL